MRKILLIIIMLSLLISGVAAANIDTVGAMPRGQWGFGPILGTDIGLELKYGYGPFDISVDIAYAMYSASVTNYPSLVTSVGFNFRLISVNMTDTDLIHLTAGIVIPLTFTVKEYTMPLNVGVILSLGMEYNLPNWPVSFLLRVGLGVDMTVIEEFSIYPRIQGGLGVLYTF